MSLSVLVVDDEKKLADMITETLKGYEAFKTVLTAYDGLDAIRKLENQKFDIVLLDMGMPKKDGMEVLRFLDEVEATSKVLIMSGTLTADLVSEARNHTTHFLTKPFKINDLKAKIAEVLKGASAGKVPA